MTMSWSSTNIVKCASCTFPPRLGPWPMPTNIFSELSVSIIANNWKHRNFNRNFNHRATAELHLHSTLLVSRHDDSFWSSVCRCATFFTLEHAILYGWWLKSGNTSNVDLITLNVIWKDLRHSLDGTILVGLPERGRGFGRAFTRPATCVLNCIRGVVSSALASHPSCLNLPFFRSCT